MDEFYKMDVFFFITTVAVVIATIVVIVCGYYIFGILKNIKYISQKAKNETDLLSEDLKDLRANVKEHGAKLKFFSNFFSSIYKKKK